MSKRRHESIKNCLIAYVNTHKFPKYTYALCNSMTEPKLNPVDHERPYKDVCYFEARPAQLAGINKNCVSCVLCIVSHVLYPKKCILKKSKNYSSVTNRAIKV